MKFNYITLFTCFLLTTLSSCQRDEIIYFEGKDAASLYIGAYEADNTSYSFAFELPSVVRDTVFLKVRVQGPSRNHDRTIQLTSKEGTDAIEGTHFILAPLVLKAGEIEALYPVVLLRTEDLKDEIKTLVVGVSENNDFVQPALGQVIDGTRSIGTYSISFNDYLTKPAYWDTQLASYVGAFGIVKFQFMVLVYGITDFSGLSRAELLNMRIRLRKALADYNAERPSDLTDENENVLTF